MALNGVHDKCLYLILYPPAIYHCNGVSELATYGQKLMAIMLPFVPTICAFFCCFTYKENISFSNFKILPSFLVEFLLLSKKGEPEQKACQS